MAYKIETMSEETFVHVGKLPGARFYGVYRRLVDDLPLWNTSCQGYGRTTACKK